MIGKPSTLIRKMRAGSSPRHEPTRVQLVEDNPKVLQAVWQALETYRRTNFVVEVVASMYELRDELANAAIRDKLTGLYSRLYLAEALEAEIRRVRRYERDLSCVVIDLDDFKPFHDVHGHEAGDAALRQTAALISNSVRDTDVVARCVDDGLCLNDQLSLDADFCVLLTETPLNTAMTLADRLRFAIATQPVMVGGRPVSITASIGVSAVSRRDDLQPETVLGRANEALWEAKAAGKNRVSAHLPSDAGDEGEARGQAVATEPATPP